MYNNVYIIFVKKVKHMKRIINPKILFIISMIIFGTIGLLIKNISLSTGEIALYRAVLAAILILGYLLITKQKL